MLDFALLKTKKKYSDVIAWEKSQMIEESSNSDYYSEDKEVSKF